MESFDGVTYDPDLDGERMRGQMERVLVFMSDNAWRTLEEIKDAVGGSEAGVSARLRDARKDRFGAYRVEKRRRGAGLWEYRMLAPVTPIVYDRDHQGLMPFAAPTLGDR